jgi:hypothetical protein
MIVDESLFKLSMMNLPVTDQEIEIMEPGDGTFYLTHFLRRGGRSLSRRDLRCSQADAQQGNDGYAGI